MDTAPAYGAGDSELESRHGLLLCINLTKKRIVLAIRTLIEVIQTCTIIQLSKIVFRIIFVNPR